MRPVYCLIVFLCLVSPAVSGIIIEHDGTTNPATEGWRVLSGIPGVPNETTGAWLIQTYGHGRWGPDTPSWYNDPGSWFENDWELSITYEYGMGKVGQQRATIFDGLHGWSTAFSWDADHAYYYKPGPGKPFGGDTVLEGVNPWEPHTYTLAYDVDTGIADVLVDGEVFDSMMPWEQNQIPFGRYLFYWGDNNGDLGGTSGLWYNLTFSQVDPIAVPEPSTILLLMMAAVGVVGWRSGRRRRRGR
jgi:hypothetical protein